MREHSTILVEYAYEGCYMACQCAALEQSKAVHQLEDCVGYVQLAVDELPNNSWFPYNFHHYSTGQAYVDLMVVRQHLLEKRQSFDAIASKLKSLARRSP